MTTNFSFGLRGNGNLVKSEIFAPQFQYDIKYRLLIIFFIDFTIKEEIMQVYQMGEKRSKSITIFIMCSSISSYTAFDYREKFNINLWQFYNSELEFNFHLIAK